MTISLEQRTIAKLLKCCGVSLEKGVEIGIMTSDRKAAEWLVDWFLEQDEMPTEAEIYQASIEASLEVNQETARNANWSTMTFRNGIVTNKNNLPFVIRYINEP